MKISPGGYVHATAIMIDHRGILIRGRSKAGKSTLAEGLIAGARAAGHTAALVGDDRVRIVAAAGGPMLSPHPAIAGLIERRGEGIVVVEHVPDAPLALVIDLDKLAEESPSGNAVEMREQILDIAVRRLNFPVRQAAAAILPLVLAALAK